MCRIYSGQYTGDGATSQAITGVGFQPMFIKIWVDGGAAAGSPTFEKTDNFDTTIASHDLDGDTDLVDNAVIAIGTDGFTVDDAGADAHPNKNTIVYNFICLG